MSAAPAPPAAATSQPDQPAIAAAQTSGINRLLRIVHWLIAYATQLATAVREHPTEPLAQSLTYWFHTPDPGVILRRLTRGLIRAAALQAWLNERAAAGRDPRTPPLRALPSGAPRSGAPAARPNGAAKAAPWWQDPDHVPTAEEAAAEVRVRPSGAVISGISEDVRVLDCAMDRATRSELNHVIDSYGGDSVRLWIRDLRWRFDPNRIPEALRNAPLQGVSTLKGSSSKEPLFQATPASARPP